MPARHRGERVDIGISGRTTVGRNGASDAIASRSAFRNPLSHDADAAAACLRRRAAAGRALRGAPRPRRARRPAARLGAQRLRPRQLRGLRRHRRLRGVRAARGRGAAGACGPQRSAFQVHAGGHACSLQNCFAEKGCTAPTHAASATGAVNDVVVQCELAVRAAARRGCVRPLVDAQPVSRFAADARCAAQNGAEAQQCWGILADMTPPDSALHERCASHTARGRCCGPPGRKHESARYAEVARPTRARLALSRAPHALARLTALFRAGRRCSARGCAQRPGSVPCPTNHILGAC